MIQITPGGFLKVVDGDITVLGTGTFGALVVGTTTLVANAPGYLGKVGINTATPAESLHIVATTGGARMLVEALDGSSAVIKMKNADANTEYSLFADGGGFAFWNYTTSAQILNYNGALQRWTFYGVIHFPDLPTSDPGIAGRLWNDSGTVKVSAG